jgi:pimeloyl-ACP methyl ester carboxylesterase
LQFDRTDTWGIHLVSGFSNPFGPLKLDEVAYVFFFPAEEEHPDGGASLAEKTDPSRTPDVYWWPLFPSKAEYESGDHFIQLVTLVEGSYWTERAYEGGYMPDHQEKLCFVLEPPGNALESSGVDPQDPVLLVHGLNGSADAWEGDVSIPGSLRELGWPVWEFYYRGQDDVPDCARMFALAVSLLAASGSSSRLDIVTHSYGGVIARHALSRTPSLGDAIGRLLMIGPPHHGSYSAVRIERGDWLPTVQRKFLGDYLDPEAPPYRELIPGSDSLLAAAESSEWVERVKESLILAGKKGLGIVDLGHDEAPSHDDGLVSLSSASLLNCGVPLAVTELSHLDQITKPEIVGLIHDFLEFGLGAVGPSLNSGSVEVFLPAGSLGPYTYADPSQTPDLYRAGLVVDTRGLAEDQVQSVSLVRDGCLGDGEPCRVLLEENPANPGLFFYYESRSQLWSPGLAVLLDEAPQTIMTLEVSLLGGVVSAPVALRPTRTTMLRFPLPQQVDSDLDGVADVLERSGPGGGDSDNDGVADFRQGNVAASPNVATGSYVTLRSQERTQLVGFKNLPLQSVFAGIPAGGVSQVVVADVDYDYLPRDIGFPVGVLEVVLAGFAPGSSVEMQIVLHSGVKPDRFLLLAEGEDAQLFTYDGHTGATLDGSVVHCHLIDGHRGDGDGRVNGRILLRAAPAIGLVSELYFAQVGDGGGLTTGLTIVNPEDEAAFFRVEFFDVEGHRRETIVADATASFLPLELASLGSKGLVASSDRVEPEAGWAVVRGSRTPAAVANYQWRIDDELLFSASVLGVGVQRRVLIPVSNIQGTGLAVCNPSDEEVALRLLLIDEKGAPGTEKTVLLNPGSQLARFVSDLFPTNDLLSFRGRIELSVEGEGWFAATGLFMKDGRLLSALPVVVLE